jgi:sec-independent protein translocase protein TatA
MGGFSLWHILIFAVILLLLFGGNRFSAMMGDVAKGLKSFKKGMSEDDEPKSDQSKPRRIDDRPIDVTPEPPRPAEPTAAPPPDDQSRS